MNFKMLGLCSAIFLGAPVALAQSVAQVGNKTITLEEFKSRYAEVQKQALNPPEPEVFLEDLIRYEMGVQEAEKRGLETDPIVKERLRQEMYKALVEKSIGEKVNKIKVTDAEMSRYYRGNPDLRTAHILIEFKLDSTPQEKEIARKRAQEILGEVKKSKRDFGDLAKLYSDDVATKNSGGDVGYNNRLTIVPSYYDAAAKLKIGAISDLVETKTGFHIIKLLERRPYEDVTDKRALRATVFDSKRNEIFDEFFKGLKSKYKIKVDKSALKKI